MIERALLAVWVCICVPVCECVVYLCGQFAVLQFHLYVFFLGGGVVIINRGVRVAVCACVVHAGVLLTVHWFVRDCLAAVQQTAAPIIVIHAFRQAL